jgi:hypothetical protein
LFFDIVLIISIILISSFIGVRFFRKRIQKVTIEYEKAKLVILDIITSFNTQFRKQENRISQVNDAIEAIHSKERKIESKMDRQGKQLIDLLKKMETFSTNGIPKQLEDLNKRIDVIDDLRQTIDQRIKLIEKSQRQRARTTEARIETAIPIKKESALAPLNETEILVLEYLAKEGEKTAPETQKEVNLTREHTARLMKKLYEGGYLERDTKKMPYVYSLKDEMLKFLRKEEIET